MPPSTALLQAILHTLPPATYAVAYGSGAVPQATAPTSLPVSGQEDPPEGPPGVSPAHLASGPLAATAATASATDAKVVDFLLAVDDVCRWHDANLAANSHHYAVPLRWAGPAALAAVQQWRWGGGVYYNTLVPWAGRLTAATSDAAGTLALGAEAATGHPPPVTRRLIKYGVISTDALTADLTGWTSLYAAGRLHKPVVTLTPPPRGLAAALSANVAAATAAAVLLLPPAFSAAALHTTAAGLSYAGDVRSAVAAEDPAKVDRLVAGDASGAAYGALYAPAVATLVAAGVLAPTRGGGWAQATGCVASRERLLAALPRGIVAAAAAVAGVGGGAAHTRRHRLATWMAAGGRGGGGGGGRVGGLGGRVGGASAPVGGRSAVVLAAVAAVVRSSSVGQAVKGILTAGPATAARYALAKLRKGRGS